VEVVTPVALLHPNLDPNVFPLAVLIRDHTGREQNHWLHTSPELSMKKLLAMGSGNIYQIGPVFRDSERSPLHRCEFTMLEWYRVQADYEDAIRDTIRVFRTACSAATGGEKTVFRGREYDLSLPWEEITMAEAFDRYADVRSWDPDELREGLVNTGSTVLPQSGVQDLFFQLYLEKVEPALGVERPVIVRDYPAFLGTMARPRSDDQTLLERFEVYIAGVEVANGYSELTDPVELEQRMNLVLHDLDSAGIKGLTVDYEFLEAVGNLPPCAGVSVGMDRLSMITLDADDISQAVFPYTEGST
jgi:lysyl-tRNA synthetase class 2